MSVPYEITSEHEARLTDWLLEAAVGISVSVDDKGEKYRVIVHNGMGGHEGVGSILATCERDVDAELLATGLWALVERHATRP